MKKEISRHKPSRSCRGESCSVCDEQATHKVTEEDVSDPIITEDGTFVAPPRLYPSNYICCECFTKIMGPITGCFR